MSGTLEKAFGYKGNNMNLPVADLATALPFYETMLGFRVLSRSDTPASSAVLARDHIQIRLAENGGDPSQDGFPVRCLVSPQLFHLDTGLHRLPFLFADRDDV